MRSLLLFALIALVAQADEFRLTGSMAFDRESHTATLLPSGAVLVAGGRSFDPDFGFEFSFYRDSAEIYDPQLETFRTVRSMFNRRAAHTATLLPDGKVLIAGGMNESGNMRSAELFDPVSETFTQVGDMQWAHALHTATLLNNGKVLIASGVSGVPAELYNPRTRQFEPAGLYVMSSGCCFTPAVKLNDGSVLITGSSPVQLYDSASNTFRLAPTGPGAYQGGVTLLPSGDVLFAGGLDSSGFRLQRAELFHPTTGAVDQIRNMLVPRALHSSTLLANGLVLLAGGETDTFFFTGTTQSTEVFDPRTGEFREAQPMLVPRELHQATLLRDGSVLITGGVNRGPAGRLLGSISRAERYVPDNPGLPPRILSHLMGAQSYPAILHGGTGFVVTVQQPAAPGEIIEIYSTGLLGAIPPEVVADGQVLEVVYSGPHPSYPGLFQVNVRVPTNTFGMNLELRHLGRSGNRVYVYVE